MNRLILIAFRNIKAHWRKSLAALLSISAAFFSLAVFEGYIVDVKDLYWDGFKNRSMFADLMIENVNANSARARTDQPEFQLSTTDQNLIADFTQRHSDLVTERAYFLYVQGLITNGKTSSIFIGKGYDLAAGVRIRGPHWAWDATYGVPLHQHANPGAVVVGKSLGRTLGCLPEKEQKVVGKDGRYKPEIRPFRCLNDSVQLSVTTESGALNALDLQVVGITDGGYQDIDKKYVMMSLENAQTLSNTKNISYATLLLRDSQSADRAKALFEQEVISKAPHLRVTQWQNHRVGELYNRTMELLGIFRNFVIVVIISISSLSVFNTMVKIIKERIREIGTLLSLGYGKGEIISMFLWESFFLTALGSLGGAVLAFCTTLFVNQIGIFYRAGILSEPAPFRIKFIFEVYVLSFLLLVTLALITTYFTTKGALRKKIVECLSYV